MKQRPAFSIRTILFYGLALGLLLASLQTLRYRLLLVGHSQELYFGLIAAFFAAIGIWFGSGFYFYRAFSDRPGGHAVVGSPAAPKLKSGMEEDRIRMGINKILVWASSCLIASCNPWGYFGVGCGIAL